MAQKKILLIDDEDLITRTVAKALEKRGYYVLVATRGEDGILIADSEDFDVVVCDIRMRGMNGIETVKKIQEATKTKSNRKQPTIFITGYADAESEKAAKALAPVAYLHKPFDLTVFFQKIEEALKK